MLHKFWKADYKVLIVIQDYCLLSVQGHMKVSFTGETYVTCYLLFSLFNVSGHMYYWMYV